MIMYDYYTMKIVFMKNVIYDFCNYDETYYEKHIYDKSIMTFVTAPSGGKRYRDANICV